MPLSLYNSLTRSLEVFEPADPPRVLVYGCGPTIYGRAHIGNFRTFVVYDLLHRYLRWKGWEPSFVVNFTDVDDKTIEGAAREGMDLARYTAPFGEAFLEDMAVLGVRDFEAVPRATEHVEEMVDWIRRLEEVGLAYRAEDGSVYFRIAEFEGYGRLSGNRPAGDASHSRIDADEYEKDDVRDFVLWKAARSVDHDVGAVWPSPWGEGRPGWHLECSVLSIAALGETLDIHLGGEDLLFPHHDNEIAQSEGVTGRTFARFWIHTKHLRVEGQKMSKSLGNTYTIPDLVQRGHAPAAIRHLLVSAQHRSELNFTFEGLEGSARAVQRLVAFDRRLEEAPIAEPAPPADDGTGPALEALSARALASFEGALDDDLNSAQALAALFVFVRDANAALDRSRGGASAAGLDAARAALESMDQVLGLLDLARRPAAGPDDELSAWVADLIEERNAARAARDWSRADELRARLAERGVTLEDTPQGTRWSLQGA
jgi:cysteinyl-tRNA synthetase